MHRRHLTLGSRRVAFLLTATLVFAGTVFATSEKVVYSFLGSPDGVNPNAGLIADAAGNFYGTTSAGGTGSPCACGTVFELSPPATAGGAWTETILHSFQGFPTDGARPSGTLTRDTQGNLYGTTLGGGNNNPGTVFELSPPATAGGAWTETVLWIFQANGRAGQTPLGKLVMDAEGDLFGTTLAGGARGHGVVFEMVKPAGNHNLWFEKVLYSFAGAANDGDSPSSNIIFRNGVIYGTTENGGTSRNGTVFRLVNDHGVWTETVLHNFDGTDGSNPIGGLVIDSSGNLFGTTNLGGNTSACDFSGCGTIFELSPPAVASDPWLETTLYEFSGHGDGAGPAGGLWRDKLGDLFGTARQGGIKNTTGAGGPTFGTVFKLKAPAVAGGTWILQPLHDFGGIPASDGNFPLGELILMNGLLYGTTDLGGNEFSNGGTVFSVVP